MSGHSKWATTKRAKAVVDAKRASAFTKVANMITVAAREKGGDIETNFSLRLAIEKARAANMPKDNIERAIKRGTGELAGVHLEEITYEGYGPGGVAIIVQVLTDSRNRSSSEIKHLFSKYGGSLGAQNSVLWMFKTHGVIRIPSLITDEQELAIIEAGGEDIITEGGCTIIITPPDALQKVKVAVEGFSLSPDSVGFERSAQNTVSVEDAAVGERLEKLLDEFEHYDDITDYATNSA